MVYGSTPDNRIKQVQPLGRFVLGVAEGNLEWASVSAFGYALYRELQARPDATLVTPARNRKTSSPGADMRNLFLLTRVARLSDIVNWLRGGQRTNARPSSLPRTWRRSLHVQEVFKT
jgi:hypothetical protein